MMTTQHESLKKKTHLPSLIMKIFVYLSAAITFTVLILLIAYIMIKGIPHLKPEFFSLHYTSDNVSFVPALITTVIMTALALIVAVPLGLFAAIYLVEYTGKRKKLVGMIRLTTETLSGIPSIVYGLFGMLFFVNTLEMGFSILAGAATLSIMILPLIMRTAEEALKSVPDSFREGSFGLGAGKTSYNFPCSSSGSSAWNYGRYHSCYRTYCWRDGGANVHGRNGCEDSEITF